MEILRALIASLKGRDTPVRRVCTGAFWTAVTTRHTGLATTYRDTDPQHSDHPAPPIPEAGELEGQPAQVLVERALSDNTVAASMGVATINSLLDVDESLCTETGAYEILAEKGKGQDVAVIGHFPFVPKLREAARHVWVIEKRARAGDIPADQAAQILPRCDVVCLTGTSLINHTIEELLALCRSAYVVLTGPSSPLSPVLFDFGIHAICGTRVTDPDTVMRYITQGATFQQLRGHGVRLLTMRRS